MNVRIRQKLDPEDVVPSVLETFFKRQGAGEYELGSWDSLWSLTVRITPNKCIHRNGYYRTQRRSVDVELPTPTDGSSASAPLDVISREPAPQEAAALLELMEEATRGLTQRDRRIIEMWAQDDSQREISTKRDTSQATVQ